jgi:prevent-host-death family protein
MPAIGKYAIRRDSMLASMPLLDDLPRHNASSVKNKWREVVREVRETGSVAITNHSTVEMVLVDAATYQQLAASAEALKAREQSVLDQLNTQFNQRLAGLQAPDAADKLDAMFERQGKLVQRPRAGTSF